MMGQRMSQVPWPKLLLRGLRATSRRLALLGEERTPRSMGLLVGSLVDNQALSRFAANRLTCVQRGMVSVASPVTRCRLAVSAQR